MSEPQATSGGAIVIATGVNARKRVIAERSADVSALLTVASAESSSVIPFGGARSVVTGRSAPTFDVGLDLSHLTGILSYEPTDLVLSVRAGTTLLEIQEELGRHNQELPLDVPFPAVTTIGGLVSTGFAGPRRLRSGSLRDLLIGCEFVRGDGLQAKAGGMVVKNVSGFEIPRFLHGSWGALAVVTSVNLKVLPRARAESTITAVLPAVGEAIEIAHEIIAANGAIDACTIGVDSDGATIAVRALGRAAAVSATLDASAGRLPRHQLRQSEDSARYWQSQVERFAEGPGTIILAASTRPGAMATLAAEVQAALVGAPGLELLLSPGLGSLRARWADDARAHSWVRAAVLAVVNAGGVYVLECASGIVDEAIDPWGVEPDGIALMRAIKNEFDPAGILNPGRLFI